MRGWSAATPTRFAGDTPSDSREPASRSDADDGAHTMAPVRPAKMTDKVTTFRSTMPEPTVWATPVPNRNAAAKLKKAAQMTALPGGRTRVETSVAIELAAS